MSVVNTTTLLRFLLARLRANYVDDALYDDDDVLVMLNDAYRDACEQSRCLQTLYTFPSITNAVPEVAVPADFSQPLEVYAGGLELERMDLSKAYTLGGDGAPIGYYVLNGLMGFTPAPTAGATATMLYAAFPTPLASYDAELDPRFPEEFSDALVHYVRWRVQMLSGGAERITQAKFDRDTYDFRVGQLQRAAQAIDRIGAQDWPSVQVRYDRRGDGVRRAG